VWLYCLQRYQGKSPKWLPMCGRPFLLVDVLGTINLVVQKSARANKQVIHVDKIKKRFSMTPKSWLDSREEDRTSIPAEANKTHEQSEVPKTTSANLVADGEDGELRVEVDHSTQILQLSDAVNNSAEQHRKQDWWTINPPSLPNLRASCEVILSVL
jgi:hypothetical protein